LTAAIQSPRISRYEHVVFRQRPGKRRRINFAPTQNSKDSFNAPVTASLLDPCDAAFLRWLFAQAGLELRSYRQETLHRRLAACLRSLHVNNVAEARKLLLRQPDKIAVATDALVIGVTSLFRDVDVFDYLLQSVLPALPQAPYRRRIWSVGSSDGDEIYSVAILLAELGLLDHTELLATDCRSAAIANIRKATYRLADLQNIPLEWRERYFTPDGGDWRVVRELRQAVQTRLADVTRIGEPGAWDMILCRNMAMYLRPDVATDLWARFEEAIRPGGFLILGKAERPQGCTRLSMVAPCIYRRDRG